MRIANIPSQLSLVLSEYIEPAQVVASLVLAVAVEGRVF